MKTFILENIYMSKESAPAVFSHAVFSTLDKAKAKAHEEYEKSLKDYCGNYNVDDIIVEECYRDLYIPCAGKAHSVRGGMKGALEILRNS